MPPVEIAENHEVPTRVVRVIAGDDLPPVRVVRVRTGEETLKVEMGGNSYGTYPYFYKYEK